MTVSDGTANIHAHRINLFSGIGRDSSGNAELKMEKSSTDVKIEMMSTSKFSNRVTFDSMNPPYKP